MFTPKYFKAYVNITRSPLPSQVHLHFEYPAVDGGLATVRLEAGGIQKMSLSITDLSLRQNSSSSYQDSRIIENIVWLLLKRTARGQDRTII
jgi:hypothetical protein